MKIKIEPKLRASAEAAVAEISAILKKESDRSAELKKFGEDAPVWKAEIDELTAKFRIGDMDTPVKMEKLQAAITAGAQRAARLNAMATDNLIIADSVFVKQAAHVLKMGYAVRDALIADVQAKLDPVFGKEEASRLCEHSTPVRVLNEMLRAQFDDGSRESTAIFQRLTRMVKFANDVLGEEWDPFKWRKSADVMRFLNNRAAPTEMDKAIAALEEEGEVKRQAEIKQHLKSLDGLKDVIRLGMIDSHDIKRIKGLSLLERAYVGLSDDDFAEVPTPSEDE